MDNLENKIKDCISKELEKGIIEQVLQEKLKQSIEKAVEELFSWRGDITKVIEGKVKSVMIPYLESYNYSDYIVKLDSVLTDVLKSSALENKNMLENFKELMSTSDIPKEINISNIYKQWRDYCKEEIDKDKIENYDYEGGYINTKLSVEEVGSGWSDYKKHIVTFECEEDEDLNVEFMITRWKKYDSGYSLEWKDSSDLKSLRYLNKFDMFMMKLNQSYSKIKLDTEYESDEIFVEYQE